jgi:parallel beta-helix repeat protein
MRYSIKIFCLILILAVQISSVYSIRYYISPDGADSNSGTFSSPFKTISKGALVAQAGDTVYVLEGVYRERVSPPRGGVAGRPIVYMAEAYKNVYIKGSDVWRPNWSKNATNIYYAVPNDALFNDDCYVDNKNPFKVASSSTPYGREGRAEVINFGYTGDVNMVYTIGQVFVDGIMYIQKPYLSEMKSTVKTWFYDRNTDNLYIHFPTDNPNNYTVEISTRRRIFAPHMRRLGYINVEGFIMEHCGNQYPANFWEVTHPEWQQAGALGTRSGHHWVIKNNMIRFANGVGIDFGNEGNSGVDLEVGSNGLATGASYHIIDSNYICDNGAGGTAAYFPSYITFTNNVLERNVNLMFVGNKRWESAGVKMHGPRNTLIANNLFRNNYGKWTLWLDGGAGPATRVHGNLIIGGEKGFDLEIGNAAEHKLIIDNNIIVNQDWGISIRNAGGITALNNLILGSTKVAIYDFIDKNRTGCTGDYQYYYNNVILNSKAIVNAYPPDYYYSTNRRFDYNIYQATATQKKFNVVTGTDSLYFSGWQTYWKIKNGNLNYDLNSKITTGLSYSIDLANLTLNLNVDANFMGSKSFPYAQFLDFDYNNNLIKNDGTALPGPFQNLSAGTNKISLWNGLKPLEIYEKLHDSLTSINNNPLVDGNNIELKIDCQQNMIHFRWISNTDLEDILVSVCSTSGYQLQNFQFDGQNEHVLQGSLNCKSLVPNLYLVRFANRNTVITKKLLMR